MMNYKKIKEIFKDVQNDKLYGANVYLVLQFLLFLSLLMVMTTWLQITLFILLLVCSVLSISSSLNMYSVVKTTEQKQSAMLNMIDFRDRHYGLNYNLFNYIKLFSFKIMVTLFYAIGFLVVGEILRQTTTVVWDEQLFYGLFLLSVILNWLSYGFTNLLYYENPTKKFTEILKESRRLVLKHKIDLIKSFSTLIVPFIVASLLSFGMILVIYILTKGENYNLIVLFSEFICMVPLLIKARYLFVYNFNLFYREDVKND